MPHRRYNAATYPLDTLAKRGADIRMELQPGTCDDEYLARLHEALAGAEAALEGAPPHLIIYNAGTDVLDGDPLGRCECYVAFVSRGCGLMGKGS